MFNAVRYLCGDKNACAAPSAQAKARRKYLTRLASHDLLEAAIPVFIAAGVSGAVAAVIADTDSDESVTLVQFTVYAILCWIVGKLFYYRLVFDEENNSDHVIFTTIRKYKLSKLLKNVLAENVGFAWKELTVEIAFTFAYAEYSWGASFATFVVAFVFFILVIYISSYAQRKILGLDHRFNDVLLRFDSDAAALPLSFMLTVLLALGLQGLGGSFISSDSYLYEWEESTDDNAIYGGATYDYYLLYATLVTFAVAGFMAFENGCVPVDEQEENSSSKKKDPDHLENASEFSLELDIGARKSGARMNQTGLLTFYRSDETAWETTVEMFHNFLGYFCGIAWFILIIDNFKLSIFFPDMNEVVSSFIAIAIMALIISYKGPDCMASFKLRQEHTAYVIKRREEAHSAKSNKPDAEKEGLCNAFMRSCYNLYLVVSHKRKDIMMLTMRLVLGWSWEVVFSMIFKLIATAEKDNQQLNTGLQCLLAVCIVALALVIHLHISDWDRPADPSEQAEAEDTTSPPVPDTVDLNHVPPTSEVIVDSETRSPMN